MSILSDTKGRDQGKWRFCMKYRSEREKSTYSLRSIQMKCPDSRYGDDKIGLVIHEDGSSENEKAERHTLIFMS
jgi:hypothetical protein